MRIVIDMQGAQTESRFRGIGRYSISLVQAMVRNRGEHEIVISLSALLPDMIEPIRAAFDGILPQENIIVWTAPGPVRECQPGNTWRRKTAEFVREAFLASLEPDVVFVTSLFEGFVDDAVTSIRMFDQRIPVAVMLYDLIPLTNPEHYLRPDPAYEQYYLRKVENLRRASCWLAISESSAKEGREAGLRPDWIINTSAACDEHFKPTDISPEEKGELLRKYGISRPFVLYTGGADIRKNLHHLIRAYARLSADLRRSHQLVLAGKIAEYETGELQKTIRSAGLSKGEVVFTGYLSDKDLLAFYNLCKLFVFASWHEGFGLPALEAMSCGAPVIASNTSSLPEMIRDDALFDPWSENSIAAKIEDVLTNKAFQKELILNGLKQAKKYSWEESAKRALEALEQLHDKRKKHSQSFHQFSRRPRLAYVSPLPLEESSIAEYSIELLPELARHYDIDVIVDQQQVSDPWIRACLPIRTIEYFTQHAVDYDRVLYHFVNSTFHAPMFDLIDRFPGVVVLHDFFLGNARKHVEAFVPASLVHALYESHGYAAVYELFHNQETENVLIKFPCNFDVLRRAIGVIAHSPSSIRLAKDWYGNSSHWAVVHQLRAPARKTDRTEAKKKLGLEPTDFLVCSFGLVDSTKQNHCLLRAWLDSKLAKDSSCKLVFVGEHFSDEYGQKLIDTIKQSGLGERIRIIGGDDPNSFNDYLSAADIAVHLHPLVYGMIRREVLDCMAHSLPTIVSTNGFVDEIQQDSVWMLPDEFEDKDLVEALETLWLDSNRCQALGTRAYDAISSCHAPWRCADMYAQAIEHFYADAECGQQILIRELAELEELPSDETSIMALASAIAQNTPLKTSACQFFLDISELVQRDAKSGIQRATRSILKELLINQPKGYRIEPVYATADKIGYRYARDFTFRFLDCPIIGSRDELIDLHPGDIFLGLDLQHHVVTAQSDYLESLRRRGVRLYFVVYDMIPIRLPEVFPPGVKELHERWLSAVSRAADGTICISRAVADELKEWLNSVGPERLRPMKIGWIHLGADLENSAPSCGLPHDASQVLEHLSARPSFLVVGTIEPRKGHVQTVAAFEQLWAQGEDANLIIVGKQGWIVEELIEALRKHPELGRRLFWLEGISDEYLEKVYAASTCLIAASEGEGFGLPLIEAAQHKLPIIARDIPVFREVAGDHAFYFSSREPADLAITVRKWLELYRSERHPRSDDMPWLTWKQSARQLLSVIIEGKWYT